MNTNILIFFIIILVVGFIVLALITAKGGASKHLDKNKYRSAWLKIEQQVDKDNQPSYHLAVLNADKLVDKALKEKRYAGNTMGERMKAAHKEWSDANNIWSAHKLRNQIAHETDVSVSYEATKNALRSFKQALKDVGAI
jgi:hypothetical protein